MVASVCPPSDAAPRKPFVSAHSVELSRQNAQHFRAVGVGQARVHHAGLSVVFACWASFGSQGESIARCTRAEVRMVQCLPAAALAESAYRRITRAVHLSVKADLSDYIISKVACLEEAAAAGR